MYCKFMALQFLRVQTSNLTDFFYLGLFKALRLSLAGFEKPQGQIGEAQWYALLPNLKLNQNTLKRHL